MAIPAEQPQPRPLPRSEVLRLNVIEQLNRLPDEGVAVLHDIAQELELRAAWSEFSQGMEEDWAAGKYADLDEALVQARAAVHAAHAK